MTVSVRDLSRITEEILLPRYGGSALDYQWVEKHEADGRSRLFLRVSPSVGALDDRSLVADVLLEFGRQGRASGVVASVWRQARTIDVERRQPRSTARAKTLPFVRE
jgi:hypothetical protein